jgi:hypothetical protein
MLADRRTFEAYLHGYGRVLAVANGKGIRSKIPQAHCLVKGAFEELAQYHASLRVRKHCMYFAVRFMHIRIYFHNLSVSGPVAKVDRLFWIKGNCIARTVCLHILFGLFAATIVGISIHRTVATPAIESMTMA